MSRKVKIENRIFNISDQNDFEEICLEIFAFQAESNPIYKQFLKYRGFLVHEVQAIHQIPFLPIEFFKKEKIICSNAPEEMIFRSSGTGNSGLSKHYVAKLELYEKSFLKCFEQFYGTPEQYCIVALLPNYQEQGNSSLVYMVDKLIKVCKCAGSGFHLGNSETLTNLINDIPDGKRLFLLGVSFSLLELAEGKTIDLSNAIIMETGGMKGRRKEMVKQELHSTLSKAFNCNKIHSEYGMTELLSQAYSSGDNLFCCPPWMNILIRDIYDPFNFVPEGKTGGINVIDLANLYSCSFIETQDLGRSHPDGSFEVLGRFDKSDVRGCNLLVG